MELFIWLKPRYIVQAMQDAEQPLLPAMASRMNRHTCGLICGGICALLTGSFAVCAALGFHIAGVAFLKRDQQLLVQYPTDKYVVNGPGMAFFVPLVASAQSRRAMIIEEEKYVVITDEMTGSMRTVEGPQLFFLGAYESVSQPLRKMVLQKNSYVKLMDKKTGERRVLRGPQVELMEQGQGVSLLKEDFMRVKNTVTGEERIIVGETLFFPEPDDKMGTPRKGFQLQKDEFVKLRDKVTQVITVEKGEKIVFPTSTQDEGTAQIEKAASLRRDQYVLQSGELTRFTGPGLVFPGPQQSFEGREKEAFNLLKGQFVRLFDEKGGVRVLQGEQLVFPEAMEFSIKGVETAIRVDEETAVIVSSRRAGADQWRLVTEKGPFIPSEDDDEVLESKIIKVDPHHVYIVTTRDGTKKFINGGNNGTAFFLQPYEQINTMRWSSGTSQKDLAEGKINNAAKPAFLVEVSCIDTWWQDAQFMFAVQTSDNVKLNLEGHIFWQIQDVPKMFANTNDPKGDVWKNTRRVLNEVVSKVTLAEFMESFNDLVKNATTADAEFYGLRGTRVHRVEVTGYTCADKRTEQTLQEVNQETTNKINRIRKQESENEVEQAKMEALIHLEQQRSKLIEAQAENERRKASFEGAAKGVQLAEQVKSFMSMLNDSLPETSDRLLLLKLFEQNEAMVENSGKLAGGNATLFVTPEDMQVRLHLPTLKHE